MAKVIERLRKGTSTVQTVLYGRGADARSQTGEYTVTGLTTDSAYQIRPYVIEDGTVVYGSALTFKTAPQASNNGGYSFMALSSSADMRVSMKNYTGNYVSNSQTEASFTYSFTLRSGVTEYGILVGNTGSELKISNSIRREAIPVGLQEVVKIVLPSGDYWEKGSGGETPDASGSPEYVDLGLSVKWAKWNMGASSINEYGGYYGWGDPTGEVVSPYTNKYAVGNTSSSIAGNPKYDIATAKWGAGWRLPTKAEFEEMIAASVSDRWTYDTSGGTKKYIASFPNGNTLVFLYDGYMNSSKTEKVSDSHGFYWTADATTADNLQMPYAFHMNGPRARTFPTAEKYMHLMIRPVYDGGGSSGGDTPDTPVVPSETPSNAVDLGLYSGNLWATYNVGATSETESGVYVAWGELQEKINEGYFKENYAYLDANNTQYGGYSTALGNNIAGTKYDIAHVRWGGTWHMPTDSDFKELRDDCTWTQETRRGVLGYKVTGPNGNSIFLPCAGYYNGNDFIGDNEEGNYWCSTMYLFAREYQMGYAMNFSQANGYELTRYSRKGGLTVRPCMPGNEGNTPITPEIPSNAVDLGLPSGLLWSSCNLGAENEGEPGELFAWADPSGKSYNQSTYTNVVEASIDDISNTEYDIATVTLGNEWHMPNGLDFEELREECEWTYITTPFVGWKVTGPNNNSILLPMCGNRQGDGTIARNGTAAFYWTSTNYSGLEAVYYTFSTSAKIAGKTAHSSKYIGMSIRPVKGNSNVPKSDEDDKNPSPYDNAAVDLGLSVDWASYNIGATKATEAGNKYAWGETEIKDSYTPNNYEHYDYVTGTYLSLGLDDISGSEYDPVHLLWGGDWQMPTNLEMMELFSECDWSWGKINGVDGFTITSKLNGNSIFLPVTEGNEGSYWSSTLYTLSGPFYNNSAYYLDFSENYTPTGCQYYYRYIGKCIRPVKIKR